MGVNGEEPPAGGDQEQARQIIRALMASAPESFAERYATLSQLRQIFHLELSRALEPAFRLRFQNRPADTLEERRDWAAEANFLARQIGLSLTCGRTGRPALLIVDSQDKAHPEVSRFRFVVIDERGHRVRTSMTVGLPELILSPDPPRVEASSRAFRRTGRDAYPGLGR